MKSAAPGLQMEHAEEFCDKIASAQGEGSSAFNLFEYASLVAKAYGSSVQGNVDSYYLEKGEADRYADRHDMSFASSLIWRGVDHARMYFEAFEVQVAEINAIAWSKDPEMVVAEAKIGNWNSSYLEVVVFAKSAIYFSNLTPDVNMLNLYRAVKQYSTLRVKRCFRELSGIHGTMRDICHPAVPFLLDCIDTLNPNLGDMAIHEEKLANMRKSCGDQRAEFAPRYISE